METARRDSHRRLLRALLALAGRGSEILSSSSNRWSSATFSGARHHMTMRLAGTDAHVRAQKLAKCLPEAEFPLRGHIVADASLEEMELAREEDGQVFARLKLAMLTVEDW